MKPGDSPRSNAARIADLLQQLHQRKLSRRSLIRSAVLLGLSVGGAEALAGCTSPGPAVAPTPTGAAPVTTASPTPTGIAHGGLQPYEWKIGADRMVHVQEPNVKAVPTIAPPPAVMPPTATPMPVMWQAVAWSCPVCLLQFATQGELVQHVLTLHTVKIPVARRVDKPTYAQYLTDQVERFEQRNHVLSRTT